ncbi:hypothetical protein SAMN05421805_106284 [Saccharopolyspora antimicrobica]|uniref:Excreted virulence factor EspC, type VII ESX diderm n=1 Tax=Saccharopolyspora antimicrobica TaxID=455193 RepID=A0A1I5BJI0_9PSEU|nr:hypothetical protein [Saccharopolyspora antimicrobica]RKT86631.1 hypothetical protein ATL45_5009 [Saccharopolyspora antimicrobica]SFN74918.1 hypothetical protein SAMN05421805_106284 [Saccharopolyspora antimicrobica]
MSQPGFEADYGAMRDAAGAVEEARRSLLPDGGSFAQSVSLDGVLDYWFGGRGAGGPIEMLPMQLDLFVKAAYQPAVERLDAFLRTTTDRLETLTDSVHAAIREYERRDQEAMDEIGKINPPG